MRETALVWFATATFVPVALAGAFSFFLAIGLLLYRVYYFLKFGYWLSSTCEVTLAMTWQGANVPDACHEFTFPWVGVNWLLHAGLRNFDASAFAIVVAAAMVATAFIWIFALAAIVRGFSMGR